MLSLCAPVTIEIQLASLEGGLSAGQWSPIIAHLAEYVNEFKVAGLEELSATDQQTVLQALEQGGKYYHLSIKRLPNNDIEFLQSLRRFEHFGSLLVDYMPEEAEVAETEAERYSALRPFIERALAVGLEVNAVVALEEWACEHLQEAVEAASDLGCAQIVCNRVLENGVDKVTPLMLAHAMTTYKQLCELSYNVSLGNCVPNCFTNTEERGCLGGIVSAAVNARGELLPCRCAQATCGSLSDHKITELWNSPALVEWRERLPKACEECTRNELCPGGCRAAIGSDSKPGDPLICCPFKEQLEALHEVVLEEDLCPKPLYIARPEAFGWALIRANQVIPVSTKAGEILQLFDGKHTLADIERQFGAAALSFIYSLYVRGFVEFVE